VTLNHFELFELAPSVDLDVKALEAKHRVLAAAAHPDRLIGGDAKSRRLAAEQSASLNDAVKILKDPVRRAFYLLELKGVKLDADQPATGVKLPLLFLEEIIELREAVEARKTARDLVGAHALAEGIKSANAQALTTAHDALRRDEVGEAAIALAKVRYYTRFLDEVDALEEENS
jgi:molecular chaperone HscB